MEILKKNEVNLDFLVERIKKGDVVVLPTDTCYGIVANTDRKTIKKVYLLKKRPKEKNMPIFVSSEWAESFVEMNENAKKLSDRFWPGALTMIVAAKEGKLSSVVSKKGTVAVREPDDNLVLSLLAEYRFPLTATSANISGNPPAYSISEVENQFASEASKPDLIIDGGTLPKTLPSTIIDTEDLKILRKGKIQML